MQLFVLSLIAICTFLPITQAQSLTGIVKDSTGNPVPNAWVYSRSLDPLRTDGNFYASTDKKGTFTLKQFGKVLFCSRQGFLPQAIILKTQVIYLEIILENSALNEKIISTCTISDSKQQIGFRLKLPITTTLTKNVGEDSDYKFFTIPFPDTNSGTNLIGMRGNAVSFGFPNEELILKSEMYSIESYKGDKYSGHDFRGQTKDRKYWRFMYHGSEVIYYENATKEAAQFFDRLLDNACFQNQ